MKKTQRPNYLGKSLAYKTNKQNSVYIYMSTINLPRQIWKYNLIHAQGVTPPMTSARTQRVDSPEM